MGRFEEAEKEERTLLKTLEQYLGRHPEVALVTLNLAATLRTEKKYREAFDLAQSAEKMLAQTVGPDNEKTKEAHQLSIEIVEAQSKKAAK